MFSLLDNGRLRKNELPLFRSRIGLRFVQSCRQEFGTAFGWEAILKPVNSGPQFGVTAAYRPQATSGSDQFRTVFPIGLGEP
jgi:hypothetical protein